MFLASKVLVDSNIRSLQSCRFLAIIIHSHRMRSSSIRVACALPELGPSSRTLPYAPFLHRPHGRQSIACLSCFLFPVSNAVHAHKTQSPIYRFVHELSIHIHVTCIDYPSMYWPYCR